MENNNAKLREAYEFAEEFLRDYGTDWELHNKLCDMLKSALSAPPRQCDIGTAEEQRRRYDEWRNHDELRAAFGKDEFEWEQMPYEANEKGEVDDSNG